MKAYKLCDELIVPAIIKTGAYMELEEYFGLPVSEWNKVDPKLYSDMKGMITVATIIAKYENDNIKTEEDFRKVMDDNNLNALNVTSVFMALMNPENEDTETSKAPSLGE